MKQYIKLAGRTGLWSALLGFFSAGVFSPLHAQVQSDAFFTESFRTPSGLSARWSGSPIVTEANGSDYALRVTSTGGTSLLTATLPVDVIKGRNVVLKAKVKGNVSTPPLPGNGIKVMLVYVSGGTTYSPQIPLGASIANWTDVCIPVEVPAGATSASIKLGLEAVTGTVWFDDVSVEADPAVMTELFDDGSIGTRWTGGAFTTEAHGGSGNALKIIRTTAGNTSVTRTLPAAAVSGRRVLITGQVKATSVSAKPNSWNGIKVMLTYQMSDGTYTYPQVALDVGTYDWTPFYRVLTLPADVISARVTLGLEAVSGTVCFDNVRIEVNPDLHADTFNDGAAAVGARWTTGTKTVVAHGAGSALQVVNATASASNMTRTTLSVDALRGRSVTLRAQINTSGVSEKPASYNGIKVMLTYKRADNSYSYPQIALGTGPYAWADVSRVVNIPADVIGAWLDIGLEKVTGTVQFDNVGVTLLDSSSPYWANPTPWHKGHTAPVLRGVMVSTGLKTSDVPTLDSWGVNLVRWQLGGANSYTLTTSGYDTILESELGKLDALLPSLEAAGIRVVVDLHSLSRGLFESSTAQNKLIQVWQTIATRYLGNTAIWAYDIANEPSGDDEGWFPSRLNWNELAERVVHGIREIDTTRTIIIEPAQAGSVLGFPALRPVRASNVVYSFHFYSPMTFTHQGTSDAYPATVSYPTTTWNAAWISAQLAPAIAFQDRYQVALYVGEFSAVRWAPGAYDWLADVTDLFEAHGWDWSYHAFREYQGWSVEIGETKEVTTPAPTPTLRQQLLMSLFGEND